MNNIMIKKIIIIMIMIIGIFIINGCSFNEYDGYLYKFRYIGDMEEKDKKTIISNYQELKSYCDKYGDSEIMEGCFGKYEEKFFRDKSLAIVYVEITSGGDIVEFRKATKYGNSVMINYNVNMCGITCDMGGYLIIVEIDKSINNIFTSFTTDTEAPKIEVNLNNQNLISENNNTFSEEQVLEVNKKFEDAYIKIIEEYEREYPDLNIKYELVYFNNDDIPDLVVDDVGYWVNLYLYNDGQVYNPIDKWPYGAGGNHGYDYTEKSGAIINYNTDYAGAILTKTIYVLNDNFELDTYSYTDAGAEISKDDEMYEQVMDSLENYGGYYLNDEKITEDEYNKKLEKILPFVEDKELEILCGEKSASEIKSMLKQN